MQPAGMPRPVAVLLTTTLTAVAAATNHSGVCDTCIADSSKISANQVWRPSKAACSAGPGK